MDEARALADRIAVMVDGSIVARGTVDEVVGDRAREAVIRFRVATGSPALPAGLASASRRGHDDVVELVTSEPTRTLHELTSWAIANRMELADLAIAPPTLEEAYLALVGEHTRVEP
jgi:ABC-2 type transport system ATP-binding protein